MSPWVIDANDMEADQVSIFQSNLLHPTTEINRFLAADNITTTIVVAPKGFGKTLLLKAKRLSIADRSIMVIPSGQALVDKPSGTPSVISSRQYDNLRERPAYWKSLWMISLTIVCLKADQRSLRHLDPATAKLFDDPELTSPCDIFDAVLSCSHDEYHNILSTYNDYLTPSFRNIHQSMLIFVDNIDEYYEDILRSSDFDGGHNIFGKVDESYWYLAQLGIAAASREISTINRHVRVFAAIRQEVLQRTITTGGFGLQLRGRSIIIHYDDDDLQEIIRRNIQNEPTANLKLPNAKDPLVRFFGQEESVVFHPKTGDQECVGEFWTRHTMRRPRDVVYIGRALSDLGPKRRTPKELRQAVRRESGQIIRAYMAEMEPHLPGFDPDMICRLITKNVLTREEMCDISNEYSQKYIAKFNQNLTHTEHVFCALFKIGLLGYVAADVDTHERVQMFRDAGSDALDEVCVLPESDFYLIHPCLDAVVGATTPKYFERLNALNVIGQNRPWRDDRAVSYVLKGDLVGFSRIMSDTGKALAFSALLKKSCEQYFTEIDHWKIEGGDSIIMVDKNPVTVIHAAQRLQDRILNSDFKSHFRFAGDAGFVVARGDGNGEMTGMAIRAAARLEPFVKPGGIWVTGEFKRRAADLLSGPVFDFHDLANERPEGIPYADGKFNIAKSGKEEDIWSEIYSVSAF